MTPLPKVPDGDLPIIQWARKIMRCLEERTIQRSPDLEIRETPTGVILRIRQTPIGGSSDDGDKPVWV